MQLPLAIVWTTPETFGIVGTTVLLHLISAATIQWHRTLQQNPVPTLVPDLKILGSVAMLLSTALDSGLTPSFAELRTSQVLLIE